MGTTRRLASSSTRPPHKQTQASRAEKPGRFSISISPLYRPNGDTNRLPICQLVTICCILEAAQVSWKKTWKKGHLLLPTNWWVPPKP
jgi:hypothetical protein